MSHITGDLDDERRDDYPPAPDAGRDGRLTPNEDHRRSPSSLPGPVSKIKNSIHETLSKASLRKSVPHDASTKSTRKHAPSAGTSAPPNSSTNESPPAATRMNGDMKVRKEQTQNFVLHAARDEDDPWACRAVLSLDGGVIRCYASLFVLKTLMEAIANLEEGQESSRPATGYRPYLYFDLIGGTSTGGLIAIMLGRLRMTVDEALDQYRRISQSTSNTKGPKWLKPFRSSDLAPGPLGEAIEYAFHQMLPEQASPGEKDELFSSDPMRCRTVLCSMTVNSSIGLAVPVLFRSYPMSFDVDVGDIKRSVVRNADSAPTCKIWEAARATSAAPSYFKPYRLDEDYYVDPTPFLSNPSWEVYKECTVPTENSLTHLDLFLSIGSEATSHTLQTGQRGKLRSHVIRKLEQLKATIEKSSDVVDEAMRHSRSSNIWYRRINVESEASLGESFEDSCQSYLKRPEVRGTLEECAYILVKIRKRRESTMLWEQFAEGIRYKCPLSSTHQACFQTRVDLKDHLQIQHGKLSDQDHHDEMQKLLNEGRVSGGDSGRNSPARAVSN
jgi:predicted acylesterase/phospholipase RssA